MRVTVEMQTTEIRLVCIFWLPALCCANTKLWVWLNNFLGYNLIWVFILTEFWNRIQQLKITIFFASGSCKNNNYYCWKIHWSTSKTFSYFLPVDSHNTYCCLESKKWSTLLFQAPDCSKNSIFSHTSKTKKTSEKSKWRWNKNIEYS